MEAMINLVRQKGYEGTRIDDVCAAAGVSKGAFFHHFASKDEAAIAAAKHWGEAANALFASILAKHVDPQDFILAYVEAREFLMRGEIWTYSCFAGTLVSEIWQTHERVTSAAAAAIQSHIDWLTPHFQAALPECAYAKAADLAALTQTVVQGALVMAKADGKPDRGLAALRHLKTHLKSEFLREK